MSELQEYEKVIQRSAEKIQNALLNVYFYGVLMGALGTVLLVAFILAIRSHSQ